MSTGTTVPTTNGTFDPDDVKRKDIDEKLYTAFTQDQIEVLDERYSGGGSGGATRYAQLPDKPSINGIELAGDKTPEALGIISYDDTALSARVSANAEAIANRYTKSETDSKIAEAIDSVDLEHFHVVTELPAIADAVENHEYVLVTYVSGTTEIAAEEHFLFYDSAYHKRNVQISLEGYATEEYVDTTVDAKVGQKQTKLVEQGSILRADIGDTGSQNIVDIPKKSYVDDTEAALQTQIDAIGEPFRVKNWASSFDISIPYCTEDVSNTSIPKTEFSISGDEGDEYQIVGMIAYEVFDAASGGNRINCWPVCQFTGNGQKTLSVRWMCAGTSRKNAKRINSWVLLKRR